MIDSVETFGGVVKSGVVDIVDCCHKLVACDCVDDDLFVPCLALGKVGSPSGFTCRSSSRRIDDSQEVPHRELCMRRHCIEGKEQGPRGGRGVLSRGTKDKEWP